jgi:hypothetical protein
MKRVLPLGNVYRLLEPGPVALLRTLHHRGRGSFMVAGETIKLKSRMK